MIECVYLIIRKETKITESGNFLITKEIERVFKDLDTAKSRMKRIGDELYAYISMHGDPDEEIVRSENTVIVTRTLSTNSKFESKRYIERQIISRS